MPHDQSGVSDVLVWRNRYQPARPDDLTPGARLRTIAKHVVATHRGCWCGVHVKKSVVGLGWEEPIHASLRHFRP